ncbi:hypothetical protein [Muricomes intestini]|nr:hypothetical protein [Muricomes intestini]
MERISRRAPLSTFDIVYVEIAEIVLFHRKKGHGGRLEDLPEGT